MSGCGNCSNDKSSPRGCKNNGTCGTDGCNKLTVFNWLSNMENPAIKSEVSLYEVRFKNDRKLFFESKDIRCSIGDVVVVEAQTGYDVGVVSLSGELVNIQYRNKNKGRKKEAPLKILRIATEKDVEIWKQAREKEESIKIESRKLARSLQLQMKISDIEFQGDGKKAIFYYTAETRVDFRQLIKSYAAAFRIGIEMRQIGYRQEAAKVGGIGSCGRELCCSSWLTDFRSVNTSAARYQQLSINPQKLAGQCGKLKCCLNFELDVYLDALKSFPSQDSILHTVDGKAYCVKIDVFKGLMWFVSKKDGFAWYKFTTDQVKDLLSRQKKKELPSLSDLEKEFGGDLLEEVKVDIIEGNNLDRFDKKRNRGNRKPSSGKRNNTNRGQKKPNTNNPSNRKKNYKASNNKSKPKEKTTKES